MFRQAVAAKARLVTAEATPNGQSDANNMPSQEMVGDTKLEASPSRS